MSANSVQRAHDALLEHSPEKSHDDCPMCDGAGTAENAKEVAEVADERTFTETEHFALLTDAVARESASLSTKVTELEVLVTAVNAEKAKEVEELRSRLDVLEAEKAAALKQGEEKAAEFEAFKTDLEEKAALEERKATRAAAVKESASDLDEAYFTDDRVAGWAAMSEDAFTSLIADLTEAAAAMKRKQTVLVNDKDVKGSAADKVKEKAVETAAFTGGGTPTANGTSLFGQFMQRTGRLPAAQ